MVHKRKTMRSGHVGRPENIPILNTNAAGMDIGADEIYAVVPTDRDGPPVQCFGTFTGELYRLSEWLKHCRVEGLRSGNRAATQAVRCQGGREGGAARSTQGAPQKALQQ